MTLATLLHNLQWREPLWLLLAVQPLLLLLLGKLSHRNRLKLYADRILQPWLIVHEKQTLVRRLLSRSSAYALAWILFAIAAAGPRIPLEIPGQETGAGLDIMLVLDMSRSMHAVDVEPDRSQRARIEIHDLLTQALEQESRKNRIGLITYAGRPHLFFPLTADAATARFYLQSLDSLRLPTYGSETTVALRLAHQELAQVQGTPVVLLITDGDFGERDSNAHQQLEQAVSKLATDGTPVYILGIGSVEGEAIPLPEGGWLKNQTQAVVSHMDEAMLRNLARLGKGKYSPVTRDNSDWKTLYTQGMAQLANLRPASAASGQIIWQGYQAWVLFPAILLLFLALVPWRLTRHGTKLFWPLLIIPLLGLLSPVRSHASETDSAALQQAYHSFIQADFPTAQTLYSTITGYHGRFGQGASCYRRSEYACAIRQFGQAALTAENDKARGSALYNLGNSYFQSGDYELARQVYKDALRYRPEYAAAQNNLSLSTHLLQQVEQRLAQEAAAGRAGSGPRRARAKQDTPVGENSSLSLGDSTERPPTEISLPPLPGISESEFDALIRKGIEHVQLAVQGGSRSNKDPGWQQDLLDARLRMQELRDDKTRHWNRLFEMEEGFPAPLEERKPIPGVMPW